MDPKNTEWRPGPSVCRCCLSEGCYKDISTEYFWMGKREVYAEMLSDTFNVTIAYSQSGGPNSNSRLICEPCISRLRDACDFKRQVLECEKTFMNQLDPSSSSTAVENDLDVQLELLDSDVKVERVKLEKQITDDEFDAEPDFINDDDDDMDDEPLTKLASRLPKKETVDLMDLLDNTKAAEKRKSSTKSKAPPLKKTKIFKTETVKASPSKTAPKTEKKKKELEPHIMAKRNAEIVLRYSTVYPFRLRGNALICVYCCEGYEDPIDFRKHVDTNHKNFNVSTAFAHLCAAKDYLKVDCANLSCRLCSQPFTKVEDIAEHLLKEHDRKETRGLHLDYDIGLQLYRLITDKLQCYHCDKKLATITRLCRHTTSHYQQYTCDICGRSYLTNDALKYHIKCNHSAKFVCRKCWKEFTTMEQRREHINNSKKCWSYCCVTCGERFKSWELKQRHLIDKHDCPERSYPCPECTATFPTRKRLYIHFKVAHTDESFICSCCGLKFGAKYQLENHRLVHTEEKQFKCTMCSKAFTSNRSLTQHMWIHSETKRFVCPICEKQFIQKVCLKGHMKAHHPEVNYQF